MGKRVMVPESVEKKFEDLELGLGKSNRTLGLPMDFCMGMLK